VTVVWTETALEHIAGIKRYIAQTSQLYAELTVRRILGRGKQLDTFPESGRVVCHERLTPPLLPVGRQRGSPDLADSCETGASHVGTAGFEPATPEPHGARARARPTPAWRLTEREECQLTFS
jgi:plasmid stabilization system protein ParE